MIQKVLGWALLLCMLAALLPTAAFAEAAEGAPEEAAAPVEGAILEVAVEEAADPAPVNESEEEQQNDEPEEILPAGQEAAEAEPGAAPAEESFLSIPEEALAEAVAEDVTAGADLSVCSISLSAQPERVPSGGSVTLTSAPGEGSTFVVSLPVPDVNTSAEGV